jgi:Holliday junction DNA helicase RuvA
MIGRLKGILIEKQAPKLMLDVHGVAYEVETSMNTFYKLPELDKELMLYTHLTVREDAHLLFGFYDKSERALFRSLIKVNGVGPKMALAILSSMEPTAFVVCIENNDTKSLVNIPGVGKKTAERLIIEMRDRLTDWNLPVVLKSDATSIHSVSANQVLHDAVGALIALGYKPNDASRMIAKVHKEGLSSEELIRLSLKQG